jgi:hypothetical protein
MQRHAQARLELGHVTVGCPECSGSIAERELRKLLPADLIDRMLARSLEQAVSATSDLKACPTPNCLMRVALEPGAPPRFKCPECKKVSCLQCGAQPYHKGMTCEQHAAKLAKGNQVKSQEEESERLFKEWMEETGTKQCPTCSMAVTKQNIKNQGTQYSECHKMVCRNCDTKFCYKCLKVLSKEFTCGCSIDLHGFIDPHTGKRIVHLKKGFKKAKASARGTQAAAAAGKKERQG